MKKKLIIPVLLSLCLLLASCAAKKGDVYLIGVSDGACNGVLGTKVDENMVARFSRESFNDDSAPASAQITAEGVTYTATYKYSDHGLMSTLTRDHYKDETGNTFYRARQRQAGRVLPLFGL